MASEQELQDMERLSAGYVPDQAGPLVGPLLSSKALTTEYAKADPVYASKTEVLPENHPFYRSIKGDGNCGFRAIAFGYFEAFNRLGSSAKIRVEAERLKSLNQLLDETGQEAEMYEDWVEVTLELLEKMAGMSSIKDKEVALLEAFNELETANAITQHFRMVTSAWMKLHIDDYAPFIEDQDVHAYCGHHIDPFFEEIEHVGLKAVTDAIVNPAGIAVDCLYLDRSPGNETTPYFFPVYDNKGAEVKTAPTMRLLYRPGHYDLLYKKDDILDHSTTVPSTSSKVVTSKNSDFEVRGVSLPPDPYFSNSYMLYGCDGFDPSSYFQPRYNADQMPYEYAALQNYYQYTGHASVYPLMDTPQTSLLKVEEDHPPLAYADQNPSLGDSFTISAETDNKPFPLQTKSTPPQASAPPPTPSPSSSPTLTNPTSLDWRPRGTQQLAYDRSYAKQALSSTENTPGLLSKRQLSKSKLPSYCGQDPEKFEPVMYDTSQYDGARAGRKKKSARGGE